MEPGALRAAVWAAAVLVVATSAVALTVGVVSGTSVATASGAVGLSFPVLGALVSTRRPRNPVGWIFLGAGLAAALTVGLAVAARLLPASAHPVAVWAAWTSSWSWVLAIGVTGTFGLLLFPDGRLPSRRWRWLAAIIAAGLALFVLAEATRGHLAVTLEADAATPPVLRAALLMSPLEDVAFRAPNPLPWRASPMTTTRLAGVGAICMLAGFVGSVLSLGAKYRAMDTRGRQQLKVVAFTAIVVVGPAFLLGQTTPSLSGAVTALNIVALALAMTFAIVRRHLLDIDVVIRRTATYAVLTSLLAVVYASSTLVVGGLLALGSPARDADITVALSTLAAAAAVRPLHGRVRSRINRRFFRAHVEAEEELERFAAALRGERDPAAVLRLLPAAIQRAVAPARISIWLREGPRPTGDPGSGTGVRHGRPTAAQPAAVASAPAAGAITNRSRPDSFARYSA